MIREPVQHGSLVLNALIAAGADGLDGHGECSTKRENCFLPTVCMVRLGNACNFSTAGADCGARRWCALGRALESRDRPRCRGVCGEEGRLAQATVSRLWGRERDMARNGVFLLRRQGDGIVQCTRDTRPEYIVFMLATYLPLHTQPSSNAKPSAANPVSSDHILATVICLSKHLSGAPRTAP